jgi:hypothetical protein
MPFDDNFNDIYEFGIKGACIDAGLFCERVDEQFFTGSILERIFSQISKADFLVADMTGRNPNVFYEVGYAHALGKNVVLLTSVAEDIPFDLKHFPHIIYGTEIKTLRTNLAKKLKYLVSEEPTRYETQIGLELLLNKERLVDGNATVCYELNRSPSVVLTLWNDSMSTYEPGKFRVAVIAPHPFNYTHTQGVIITVLPDGNYMHMLPQFDTLFPSAYTAVRFTLGSFENVELPAEFSVNIRIFSAAGMREFPLTIRKV